MSLKVFGVNTKRKSEQCKRESQACKLRMGSASNRRSFLNNGFFVQLRRGRAISSKAASKQGPSWISKSKSYRA